MPAFTIKFRFRVISGMYFYDDIAKKVSDIMSKVCLGVMKEVRRNGTFHSVIPMAQW